MEHRLQHYLALIAPGTDLRQGLERIVQGRTGALLVLDDGPAVLELCSGGFAIDAPFTPAAVRELSKLDGGIVLTAGVDRIVRAGVHFVPRGDIDTPETGTRHRSADRVARQAGVPVVTVSASMSTISLFLDGQRHLVEPPQVVAARTNQALTALISYRQRSDRLTRLLNTLEVQDRVTVADVATLVQHLELARRLEAEISESLTVLGVEGRLLGLQLAELVAGANDITAVLARDYDLTAGSPVSALDSSTLADVAAVARTIGFGSAPLEQQLHPKGLRQLAALPRVSESTAQAVLDQIGGLQDLFVASLSELSQVPGVGPRTARTIRDGLLRLAESAIID